MSVEKTVKKQATKQATKPAKSTKQSKGIEQTTLTTLVYKQDAAGLLLKKHLDIERRSGYSALADLFEKDGLKPTRKFESRDKLSARIVADLTKDGIINADTKKAEVNRIARRIMRGVYYAWGIYGSGTAKRPFVKDKDKLARTIERDKTNKKMLSNDVIALAVKILGF